MPKNNTVENIDAVDPVVDDINQDPQPARDVAAADIATQTGMVTVRLLTDFTDSVGNKVAAGNLIKASAEIAAGLVSGGVADAHDSAVSYALDTGIEIVDY